MKTEETVREVTGTKKRGLRTDYKKHVSEMTEITHEFYPKQKEFVFSDKAFPAFIGGIGSGKTRAGAMKMLKYVAENPVSLGMIVAPTYPMLRDATFRVIKEILPKEGANTWTYHAGENKITFWNGSEALMRSADDPDHLRGPNLAWFWFDEAAQMKSELAFEILQGRLRQEGFPHQGWVTTTPNGYNWVYTTWANREERFQERSNEDYPFFRASVRDNVFLTPDFVKRLEANYKGAFALQEIEGQFTLVGGSPYFDPEACQGALARCLPLIEERKGGAVKIWKRPNVSARYIAGGDLAWGMTGAYSCMTIVDMRTGVQMAELYGRLPKDEMAMEAVKLLREYNNAFVGMERNGEGIHIINKMKDLGYQSHMFWDDWEKKQPEKLGWETNQRSRSLMLSELEEAIRLGLFVPQCEDGVKELLTFERKEGGGPPGPVEGTYSDHVMSWAIAWQMRHHTRFSTSEHKEPILLGAGF